MTAEQLAAAVRYLDEQTADKGGHQMLEECLGTKWDDLAYMADQRALRIILIMLRNQPVPTKMEAIKLTSYEQLIAKLLLAAHVDGMAIGIAASKGLSAPMPNTQSEN